MKIGVLNLRPYMKEWGKGSINPQRGGQQSIT